ncbi:YrrS family protein [Bacillus sp. OAE603]|uniref:YrrS family protein n=1 Tax=Gottfriedia sp. OAE603 TaxID=2663872 RepID=UPI00178957F8
MVSVEKNGRVRKLRKERRGNYFFRILLVPLITGIVYLGVKISMPIIEQQKIEPKQAIADYNTTAMESKLIATDEPNPYQAKYRDKVNEIIKNSIEDENIIQSTVKEWNPTVTSQTGEHIVQYSFQSKDFYEMEEAVSNAISLTKKDFSVWHLGRGYDDQSVKMFVATTDLTYKYIVHLHWVENEGWLPILVQEVKELTY